MIVDVQLDNNRTYPVYINENRDLIELIKEQNATSIVVVTNDTISEIYSSKINEWEEKLNALTIVLPDGEKYKTLDSINTILDTMLEAKLDRKTLVIAFGGGVIGDMTGFAASLFLRGVSFIQIPTTLLAMVDSSVGGKTAVNHRMGKNLIGAFYQPKFVWIDTDFLNTLEEREFIAGCGEVFKYSFIGGNDMFTFVKENFHNVLARDENFVEDIIKRSIEIKADVVSKDEKEQGLRALLNFGHTFGHVLEKEYNYSGILHGEGVFWGIRCAIELGIKEGFVPQNCIDEYESISKQIIYPKLPYKPDVNKLYDNMFSDKKVEGGKIKFIIPTECGSSVIAKKINENSVKEVMKRVFNNEIFN